MVTNSGDLDGTELLYYNGHQVIEARDGSENVLRQVVHGTRYIDEVVLEILEDGVAWVHQAEGDQGGSLKDWNAVALILDSPQRAWPAGRAATLPLRGTQRVKDRVLERNHQTPYGIITVDQETYFGDYAGTGKVEVDPWDTNTNGQLDSGDACWGSDPTGVCRLVDFDCDDDVDAADSARLAELDSSTTYRRFGQAYSGLGNTRAHQGLIFDAEIASYNNRARQYDPNIKRFMQRDPLAFGLQPFSAGMHYVDGLTLYQRLRANPARLGDPGGLACHDSLFTHLTTDPVVAGIYALMTGECCNTEWKCGSCGAFSGGSTTCAYDDEYIHICVDSSSTDQEIGEIVRHEAWHVMNCCNGTDWPNCTPGRAREEIEAAIMGQACTPGGSRAGELAGPHGCRNCLTGSCWASMHPDVCDEAMDLCNGAYDALDSELGGDLCDEGA